ncbi:MAG: chemotaxis protein CheA [Deltaproteobacteria bacterium]|nr:chemotaxis protein CheA [Deltaproteobacteria bacterium]RLB46589.1 MAG: chemotaxis protein CheA [Deltaproteobacteria bacterium]
MSDPRDNVQQEFLSEAQELVEALSRDLLLLDEAHHRNERIDPALVNEIFRSVHTLKGIAGMFGYKHVGVVAHALEDLLDDLRLGRTLVEPHLLDVLFDSVERFQQLLALEDPQSPEEEAGVQEYIAAIRAIGTESAKEEGDPLDQYAIEPAVLSVLTEYEEHRLRACIRQGLRLYRLRAAFDLTAIDDSIETLRAVASDDAEIITYLPSMEGGNEDTIELVVLLASGAPKEQLEAHFEGRYGTIEAIEERTHLPTLPPRPTSIPSTGASMETQAEEDSGQASLQSVANSVRVDIRKLDHLMNVVGELALVRSAVNRIVDQFKGDATYRQSLTDLDRIGRGFERQLAELRTGILDVRMVPLGQVFNKLARIVRQAAREHDKQVRLVVTGANTEVDKLIVEKLTDPLMHLVRNAIDHGIEPGDARIRAAKPAEGTLALNAYHKGSNVVIEVEDDGGGMNALQLQEAAVSRGLLNADAGLELSRQEMLDLVFLPGLSTRSEVTDLSGRGVGMDVVKTNILRMGGVISIESEQGSGTKITVTLPITLAIIRALIVTVASRTFALPITVVREAIPYIPEEVRTIEGREVITLRGETLAICDLARLFGFRGSSREEGRFVVVGSMGNRELGFVVDGLVGQDDVIIKALGKSLASVRGFAGATDLGDRKVALVLDAPALFTEHFDGPEAGWAMETHP